MIRPYYHKNLKERLKQIQSTILKSSLVLLVLGIGAYSYVSIYQYPKKVESLVNNAPVIETAYPNPKGGYYGFYSKEHPPVIKIWGLNTASKSQETWEAYQKRVNEINDFCLGKTFNGKIKVLDLDGNGIVSSGDSLDEYIEDK